MEASTLQAPAGLARHRIAIGIPLLRLRSDEQLVALFRAGHDEAFRVIHDRYQRRLLAYTRQMLPRGQDAEDALQDVFVRAYAGLRSSERELALRAWLFRVAHNRCVDELRRPAPPAPEVLHQLGRAAQDPAVELDRRESLRRLIADVRRLPDQQRSALLMREMGGMSYVELAGSLGTSVPAVKSLLVRARIALAQAAEARDTACSEIREDLVSAHDRGVRPTANAKRHMRDCTGCRSFRRELRAVNRQLAAIAPIGPLALFVKLLGLSGGAGGGATASGAGAGGATAGGGVAAVGGAAGGGGAIASGAIVVGSGHVATLLAAAVATAGGAVAVATPPAQSHARPAAKVQSVVPEASRSRGIAAYEAYAAPGPQDATAAAVGTSLLTEAKVNSVAEGKSGGKQKPRPAAPASATPAASSQTTADSTTGAGSATTTGTGVGAGLNGGTDPSQAGATPTGSDSTTSSTGSGTQSSGTGSGSTSGSQPSGSSSPGSTTTGSSSGTTTNTTNGGTGGTTSGSTSGTGTSSGTGSGSGTSSSGSGTFSSSTG